ncbi:ATP-binding protein [Allosphingosinicella deserti]|uniref:histidine kinase n=1 Tax=Allosphingosinicella deserti TaxID=2116704 RepID=A0A2P7QH49_9SPHN|nr:ATP-binding protein [Sphingomonas deserti]PSJ37304.1 sensor histidine kinase [Sphingomonas deserti]
MPPRLFGRVALVILVLALLQVSASLLFYRLIDRHTARADHARRAAELLVVSHRLDLAGREHVSQLMTTRHLTVSVNSEPLVPHGVAGVEEIREEILSWEPELGRRALNLDTQRSGGREHLVGSMQLSERKWLNFRSANLSARWPIAAKAATITLLLTLVCLVAVLYTLRLMGAPLRRLAEATERIGEGARVSFAEHGPRDVRNLSRAFNQMQERLARLVSDQASAFEAISHDLRTPLSRIKIAADFIEPEDIRDLVADSSDEMESMLSSLQRFLRAQQVTAEPGPIALGELAEALRQRWGDALEVDAPRATIMSYSEPLTMALDSLIENALQYGGRATLSFRHDADGWMAELRDFGPGIPASHLVDVLTPFFRLDAARARNTGGFGLGIPTAHRLLLRFGGSLDFDNHGDGGLVARVRLPITRGSASLL